jgi:16S rRNA (uracil1498-N3)-methyltransferase
MTQLKRFYLPSIPETGIIQLDKQQSHHLKDVLRLRKGQEIEVFNKLGHSYLSEIIKLGKTQSLLCVIQPLLTKSQTNSYKSNFRPEITLATAIPKGNRMDNLVKQVSELELNRLIPINTQRSVVIATSTQTNKINRWKRIAIESNKQSHQPIITKITAPLDFKDALKEITHYDIALIGALKNSTQLSEVIKSYTNAKKILYFIGPEDDFTHEELISAQQAGVKPVLLPVNSILRVETAAVVMLSMLLYGYTQPA